MKATDVKADEVKAWAEERLAKQRLPLPKKPRGKEPEFEFPEDPDSLSSNRLGQLMLQMAAFGAYAQRLHGLADSEFALVEAEYKIKISAAGIAVRERLGRVAADVVESVVLGEDKTLGELYERRLQLQTVLTQLESRLKIYENLGKALSRELSRREMEVRAA